MITISTCEACGHTTSSADKPPSVSQALKITASTLFMCAATASLRLSEELGMHTTDEDIFADLESEAQMRIEPAQRRRMLKRMGKIRRGEV